MVIKEVIVVEGRDDTTAIKRAVKADTIETRGSAIPASVIEQIRKAQELRGVIVFTDPDYPGGKIRNTISEKVPGVKHAFITREEARKNNNIGVENASPDIIKKALQRSKSEWIDEIEEIITWDRLIDEGLVGGKNTKERRIALGNELGIGYANAKQLYKKLIMFQVSEEEFSKAINAINDKDENDER